MFGNRSPKTENRKPKTLTSMLAALVVHLKANYGNLTSGLNTAKNAVGSTVSSIRRSVGGVAGAFAGLASVGGVIAGVTSQMQALDQVADVGSRTGFGAATISGLGFAAQLSGSDVETLQASLGKFSAVMGQAAIGTGAGVAGLERLGLNFENLRDLSPDEQLLKVADAMAQLPNEAARNAAAMQLFGKSGAALAPMLSQGSAGLQEFIGQAKQMGLGFSQEELDRVAAANDAIDTLKATGAAAFGSLAVAVAPVITSVVSGIQEWIGSFGGVVAIVDRVREIWVATQNAIATGIVYAMTVAEFAMANWQSIGMLAVSVVMHHFARFFGVLGHFWGTVVPAWFTWFGSNWSDVFFTAFDLASSVFINLGTNIRRIMGEIWDFIASGGTDSLEMAWTPLTEGFVNSIESLPDVPARIIGPLEQQLADEVASLSGSLGGELGTMLNDRLDALKSIQGTSPATATAGGAATSPGAAGGDAGGASGGESKGAGGALKKGSAEAFSAIFAAMRGSQNGKEAQALKAQQVAAKAAQATAVNTDKIATALQGGATIAVVESL